MNPTIATIELCYYYYYNDCIIITNINNIIDIIIMNSADFSGHRLCAHELRRHPRQVPREDGVRPGDRYRYGIAKFTILDYTRLDY